MVYIHTFFIWVLFVVFAELLAWAGFWELAGLSEPQGLIFQGSLFLIFYLFMKAILFDPMHRVFVLREEQTRGKKNQAQQIQRKSEELLQKYEGDIQAAKLKATRKREQMALEGEAQEREIIQKSRENAQEEIKHTQVRIEKSAQEARKKLSAEVTQLQNEIVQQFLSSAAGGSRPKQFKKLANS